MPLPLPLIRCFNIAEGLNSITRRGEIGSSVPVFGLRPIRWPFLRTMNDPNDDNFTVSPFSRQSVISFKTSSTKADDSVRDKPTFWQTASHRSTRVTVFPVPVIACPTHGEHYVSEIMSLTSDGQQRSSMQSHERPLQCGYFNAALTSAAAPSPR